MAPNNYSTKDASNWKEAVESIWRKQKTILILTLVSLIPVGAIYGIFFGMVNNPMFHYEIEGSLYRYFMTFIFIALGHLIVIYAMNWVLYASLRRWFNIAPESLKKSIKLISIGLMIVLISSVVSSLITDLETAANLAVFAGVIVQFVGIVQLRNAEGMPEVGRKGASKIMWGYIISWVISFVAVGIFVSGMSSFMLDHTNDYDYDDDYVSSSVFNSYDDDYYDDYDEELSYEEEMMIMNFINSNEFFNISLITLIVALIGWSISIYFTYRGWWLISKSELPVLSEPTEELSYEDVTEASEQKCDIAE